MFVAKQSRPVDSVNATVNATRLAKAHGDRQMLRRASLCISRYANEAKTFCSSLDRRLFFPSLCVTGSLLSGAFIPYKALPEAT